MLMSPLRCSRRDCCPASLQIKARDVVVGVSLAQHPAELKHGLMKIGDRNDNTFVGYDSL